MFDLGSFIFGILITGISALWILNLNPKEED